MTGSKGIIRNLLKQDISSILDDIQVLLNSSSAGTVSCTVVCDILRAIHQFLSTCEKLKKEDGHQSIFKLIPSINLCIDFATLNFAYQELIDGQFLSILYHFTQSFLNFDLHLPALSFAESLKSLFTASADCSDGKNMYAKSMYALLWNKALEMENNLKDYDVGFKLRCKAVEFLLLEKDCFSAIKEKTSLILMRYCHKNEKSDPAEIKEFLQSVWIEIYNRQSDSEHQIKLCIVIYSWLEALLKYSKISFYFSQNFLRWFSEISRLSQDKNEKVKFLETCSEISKMSIHLFLLKENVPVSNQILLVCEKLQKLCNDDDCENELLDHTLYLFYLTFLRGLSNLKSAHDNCLSFSKAHITFCSVLVQHYFKVSSDTQMKKFIPFDLASEISLLHCFISLILFLLGINQENVTKQELLNEAKNVIELSLARLTLAFENNELHEKSYGCANVICNLGFTAYNSGFYESSCYFLEISSTLMSDSEIADKYSLWKIKQILTYCYFFSDCYEKALQCVVKCLLAHKDKAKECIELWKKVKKNAFLNKKELVNSRCISDILLEYKLSASENEEINFLLQELKSCKFERYDTTNEILAIVKRLFCLPCQSITKADILLEIITMPANVCQNICDLLMKSGLEICGESIQLLESHILENPADNEAKLQLSVGYFWLYHLIFEKLHKFAEQEVNSAMKPAAREVTVNKNDDDDIEENDFCDIKPAFPHLTLPVENEMVKSLERAFQLWTEVSDDSNCNWMDFIEIIHHWKILDVIHATAEIYATNAHDLNELNAWILLYEISSTVGDKEHRFIACLSLLNFFIGLGYLDLSAHFLNDIETNIYCSEEVEVLKFKLQLVKSKYNLHTGKFDEGLQLLQSVLSTSSEKCSKSWKMIQIEALVLQSQYLSVPRSAFTDSKNFEFIQRKTAIAIAMEAVTRSLSLLKFIAEKQFSETYPHDWMSFKPSLLRHLLKSCFYLGELCFQAGEPRSARCYLQEGLKIAEAHILTYWSSKMLLLLGQIDLFCDNPEDCMVKLNGLKYIMSENSNISISTLLSKVHEETDDITHSSFEDLNIHSKDGISLLWDFRQGFIKNSDVHSSPVSSKKKSGKSVNQVSSSAYSRFSVNLVQTEIAFLSSLYFIAQGETTGIESELKTILRDCDNLKKLTLISNKILSAKLCDSVNELCRNPSKPEVMLLTLTALKLSLIHLSNGSSDEAENYINLASASLTSASEFYKYLYPNIYALIKYQKIIVTLKHIMKMKPNFSVEYQICPSIKSCYQMTNVRKSKKASFNCSTPCNKTVTRSTGAHHSSHHEKCRAPIKRETLPSHIKKDLTSKPSFQFSIKDSPVLNLSNSEDELVFESPKKDTVFQTESKSTRKRSSRQEKVKKKLGDEYKFFKSRNFNLQVTSASDIWNLALLDTPKKERKPLKSRAGKTGPVKSIKPRRKTGAVKSESNCPQKTSNISSDVSGKSSKSDNNPILPSEIIYEDNNSSKASCDFKSNDFLRPRIFIESSRSSPRDPSIPEVNLTDNSEHDLLFPPNETFSSSDSRTEDLLLHTVSELCEDVTAVVITESINDSKDLAIPEMKLKEFIAELKDIKQLLHHTLPYPIYADLCRLLAILLMNQSSDEMSYNETLLSVGFLLSETCSVTLRSIHITNLLSFKVWEESEEKKSMLNSLKAVDLPIDVQMQNILNTIPKDWTVLQISALSAKENAYALNENSTPTKLIVCRYQHNSIPLVSCIDSSLFCSSLFVEFEAILLENKLVMKNQDARTWWKTRSSLDFRLKALAESMENTWLGCWKGLCLGKSVSDERTKLLLKKMDSISEIAATANTDLLQCLLDSATFLSREQLTAAICQLWKCNPFDEIYSKLCTALAGLAAELPETERHPVILILDKNIQGLPWECMPILKNVPVTRMPSLNLLSVKLNSQEVEPIVKTGIDCEKGYYILNPSGDLMESQSYFQTQFEKQTNWKGITGRPPSPTEYISALRDYDLFIYCGHGTGRKYIEGNAIGKIKCHATAILMGCSSGRLKRLGKQSEADGIALKYLLNGCPCVVGNLWDVTDKDIDRFTEKLIKLLVPNYSSNENLTDVAHATCIARNVCKLKYLVGAAPIVYGFPISAKK